MQADLSSSRRAGRHELAEQVREARSAGVDTFAWLASSRGARDFTDYADSLGADLLVVPEDMHDEGLLARLRGAPAPGEIAEKAEPAVLTVPIGEAI